MSHLPNGLRRQRNELGNAWSTDSFRQLSKRHPAQHCANRLNATAEEFIQRLLILLCDINA